MNGVLVGFVSIAFAGSVCAQAVLSPGKLRPPSRSVFKCVDKGRTVFSDEPCPGAERIEVEPNRGVNGSTGVTRKGADVQREEHREALAEAVKPLTGMNAKQLDKASQRMRLEPPTRTECAHLDRSIDALETRERALQPNQRAAVQQLLFVDRQRYRKLGC
jgi:hypothetical protein